MFRHWHFGWSNQPQSQYLNRNWAVPDRWHLRRFYNVLDILKRVIATAAKRQLPGTDGLHCRQCPNRHSSRVARFLFDEISKRFDHYLFTLIFICSHLDENTAIFVQIYIFYPTFGQKH